MSALSERSNIYIHTFNTIFRMKNTLLKDLKALALQGLKQGRKKAVRGAAKGKAQGTRTGTRTRSGANIINLNINFISAPVSNDTHHFYAPVGQVANTMSNNIKEEQKGE